MPQRHRLSWSKTWPTRSLTVRTHIQRAMMKLHARDRAQLVVIAYQAGLVQPAPL